MVRAAARSLPAAQPCRAPASRQIPRLWTPQLRTCRRSSTWFASVVVAFVLLGHLVPEAVGHAVVIRPPSRPWWAQVDRLWAGVPPDQPITEWTKEWTPHGLNAGGPGKVSAGNTLRWPQGLHGRCGDPYDSTLKRYETPAPNYDPKQNNASFAPGQDIDFHVLVNAHHWGRWQFRICPADFTNEATQCIFLKRVNISSGQLVSPETDKFYPPPAGSQYPLPAWTDPTFTTYILQGGPMPGSGVYVTRFRMPNSVPWAATTPSLIQWYWASSNTCNPPPCLPEDWKYNRTEAYRRPCGDVEMCGEQNAGYPEEFWNCIDIHVAGTNPQPLSPPASASPTSPSLPASPEVPSPQSSSPAPPTPTQPSPPSPAASPLPPASPPTASPPPPASPPSASPTTAPPPPPPASPPSTPPSPPPTEPPQPSSPSPAAAQPSPLPPPPTPTSPPNVPSPRLTTSPKPPPSKTSPNRPKTSPNRPPKSSPKPSPKPSPKRKSPPKPSPKRKSPPKRTPKAPPRG